jgi:uncharacterized membrane protein
MVSQSQDVKRLVYSALFIAIVFVATYINIHIPILMGQGGLVHLGTLVMFIIAIKYGRTYGALAGGVGMALFDLLSIWATWAPGTLVVRIVAGFVMGQVALSKEGQGKSFVRNVLALLAGGAVIVVGYWLFEGIFLGYGLVPALGSVPGNILQIVIASLGLFLLKSMPELETK